MNGKHTREIIVARSAGYCYGVRRAVRMVEELLEAGKPVATIGPIIHNARVVGGLERRGARVVLDLEDVRQGECAVIRSHGLSAKDIATVRAQGAQIVDAVCPHVKKIHAIVEDTENAVVVGDCGHPEVQAIAADAKARVDVVGAPEDFARLPHAAARVAVAQTTSARDDWEDALVILRGRTLALDARDTICEATATRQAEAVQIAQRVDVMLVVGDAKSANTQKLRRLCEKATRTYAVQGRDDIPVNVLRKAKKIGITAGASTPDEIIKEVVTYMSELDNKTTTENPTTEEQIQEPVAVGDAQEMAQEPASDDSSSFMAEFEKTLVSIKPGQIVVGTIVQITEDEVCVNIGYKSDGIVKRADLISEGDPRELYSIGGEIEVEVVKVNDGEGNVALSQRNVLVLKNWDGLVEKFEAGEYVEGVGKDVVKGGLICTVEGVRTFVPASQLAGRYVEKIDQFVGQEMKLKIIEVDRSKRRLVASRKAVIAEESKKIKEELWEKLTVGATVRGVVRRLTDFGAFVDVGGMDGLIHVTDLSWGRVRHPSDVVKPNDEVDVQVLGVDRERERISLGLKQLQARPWDNAAINYPIGSIVEGKVVRMVTFGAFVELEQGLDGLVHISQIANTRVERVEDVLQAGQMVNVKVLDVNAEAKRISLSIREALGVTGEKDELGELPDDLDAPILAMTSEGLVVEEETPVAEEAPAVEEAPTEE